jgi:hypothetical protein
MALPFIKIIIIFIVNIYILLFSLLKDNLDLYHGEKIIITIIRMI